MSPTGREYETALHRVDTHFDELDDHCRRIASTLADLCDAAAKESRRRDEDYREDAKRRDSEHRLILNALDQIQLTLAVQESGIGQVPTFVQPSPLTTVTPGIESKGDLSGVFIHGQKLPIERIGGVLHKLMWPAICAATHVLYQVWEWWRHTHP